ncbi:UPF0280 family protein [Inquilinus sp.]|uniref:UPF0280 family protein n=1 Tax=Inquilinus sp. TaxID=1932117 RepID=UPI0031E2F03B
MARVPQIALLPDGRRLHLQDGPIDLIVEANGAMEAVQAAYQAAARRFTGLLDELCDELPLLRTPARPDGCALQGPIARRMHDAVAAYAADGFITPMAAVAGAVAEAVLAAMSAAAPLARAYVNNGGDIALYLAPGQSFTVGLVDRPDRPGLFGTSVLTAEDGIRGIATSGWRGRSFSLGIADAVTILAAGAAEADAAATVVANAVDLPGHPAIQRVPARELQPDSDLGDRPVTRGVGPLAPDEIDAALAAGAGTAETLIARGLIRAAALHLSGETRTVGLGENPLTLPPPSASGPSLSPRRGNLPLPRGEVGTAAAVPGEGAAPAHQPEPTTQSPIHA